MESMPFPVFPDDVKYEADFDDEIKVYSFVYQNSIIFGFKNLKEYISFIQVKKENNLYSVENIKVKPDYRGQLMFIKMIKFLNEEKGYSLYLNKFHSIGTEMTLKKIDKIFNMFMYNLVSKEKIEFTYTDYINKTVSKGLPNDWVVLFEKMSDGLVENSLGWASNRKPWTYVNWFNNINNDLLLD